MTGVMAGVLGIGAGATGMHYTIDAALLAKEKAMHAQDNEQAETNMAAVSATAASAASAALAKQFTMQAAVASAEQTLSKEAKAHELDNQTVRDQYAAGARRLRVRVQSCEADDSARGGDVSGTATAVGNSDASATYADLDATIASRVFGVAGDDQREIDKVKVLQAYACTVQPKNPGCVP